MTVRERLAAEIKGGEVVNLPGVELRLSAEHALRAAIDSQVFSALRELEPLDGGRAVQSVYIALLRRLPNVMPDRKRISIDCGFSESSVKRAIKLLEATGLVSVSRTKGFSSVYHLADIRLAENASECLSRIRKMSRDADRKVRGSRATSEPAGSEGRVTSGPGGRVTGGRPVGPQVARKEAMKNQHKQQGVVACEVKLEGNLEMALKKWGLLSASYLVRLGHGRAIPLLAENPSDAAELIDRTMRKAVWSADAGVGARVEFLRTNVEKAASERQAEFRARRLRESRAGHSNDGEVIGGRMAKEGRERSEISEEPTSVELERTLEAMPEPEFASLCGRLFSKLPGLRKLYPDASLESRGLKLRLVEFLREEGMVKQGSDSNHLSLEREAASEPVQ